MADDAAPQIKPFAQFLQEQRRGALHDELSEDFAAVVRAVQEHQKVGKLTITISVKPADDGLMVAVSDDTKMTAPKGDRPPALFFVDEAGNVSRQNPRQIEMSGPLRDVSVAPSAPDAADAADAR